jgi:hypothetical protein
MFRIDARVRIDLKGIIIVSGVFKQTIEGIEHFVGKQEKELATERSAFCRYT